MKVAKAIGWLLGSTVLLMVLIYLVLVAINWNDRPPSAAAREFERILADRPAVTAEDNALVYLLGFGAPTDGDPVEMGARRMAWLENYHFGVDLATDPLKAPLNFKADGSPLVTHLLNACGQDGDRKQCVPVFETISRDWLPSDLDALALRRYESLLTRRAWRDIVPLDVSAPMPDYNNAMHAQRLYLLRLAQWALQGRLDEVRAGLATDFEFWRTALPAADSLLGQMIAVAALRQHFTFANLVLRGVPPEQVSRAMPPDWSREFGAEERSMRRVLAAETASMKRVLTDVKQGMEAKAPVGADGAPTFAEKWMGRATDPLFQLQDTINTRADRFMQLCQAFEVPMDRYVTAQQNWLANDRKPGTSMYNLIGGIISSIDDGSTYAQYPLRAASVEGVRRAALLAAQLRARGLSPDLVGEEISRTPLRDPYTDKPFEWDIERRSVIFSAPEKHQSRRSEFFY
jgi:hypothetical protein